MSAFKDKASAIEHGLHTQFNKNVKLTITVEESTMKIACDYSLDFNKDNVLTITEEQINRAWREGGYISALNMVFEKVSTEMSRVWFVEGFKPY